MTSETDIWTVKAALDWTCGYLERKGDQNPRVSAEWLLSEACDLRRIELYMNPERPLSGDERALLRDYVARRGQGEPLQYITGEAPFRYIAVKVRPGVLIPRPETEVLVSEALACLPTAARHEGAWNAEAQAEEEAVVAALKERIAEALAAEGAEGAEDAEGSAEAAVLAEGISLSQTPADLSAVDPGYVPGGSAGFEPATLKAPEPNTYLVADICTGTGCIACSIASERPDTRVIAVDLAPEAVALARENAAALDLEDKVRVLQGDLGAPIPERYLGRFDLIVSNPPYVPTAVLGDIPQEVAAFEPTLALDGGEDGLDLFRRLTPWAHTALKAGGAFACELHETCLEAAADIACEAGFSATRIVNDLVGKPRVLVCVK